MKPMRRPVRRQIDSLRRTVLRNPVFVGIVAFSAVAGLLGLSASIAFIRATGRYPVHEGEVINWLFGLT